MIKYRLLLPLLLLFSLPLAAEEANGLEYRLSYSGLLTGFIWKELADVTLALSPEKTEFQGKPAARISMVVDTTHYGFAETLHPLRYRWESILSPDLQRTLLVRIVDKGVNDSHEVAWYNWERGEIDLFRKRKQVDKSIPIFDSAPILEWEKDKLPPAPSFIDSYPPVAPGLSYLYHSKHKKEKLKVDAIDPLTMLFALSRHDYGVESAHTLQILLDDDQAPYRAQLFGKESLKRGACADQALKVAISRGDEKGEEGAMTMWVSDDDRHIPLRVDVEAPLGSLHVVLKSSATASGKTDCRPVPQTPSTPAEES